MEHYEFEGGTYTLEDDNIVLTLAHNITSLQAGEYLCDIYKVTYIASHSLPADYIIEGAWARPSSSTPFQYYYTQGGTDYFFPDEHVTLTSVSENSATLKGYVYHIISQIGGGSINQWYPSNTNVDQTFDYTLHLKFDGVIGIDEIETNTMLYPNPTNEQVHVKLSNGNELESIEVFDATGRMVMKVIKQTTLNIGRLPVGMYQIRLTTNQSTVTKKLVKCER